MAAVRVRAQRVKAALVAATVALFAVAGGLARAAHPGASASGSTVATHLSPPSDLVAALSRGGDEGSFGGGAVGPPQGEPAASTSTS